MHFAFFPLQTTEARNSLDYYCLIIYRFRKVKDFHVIKEVKDSKTHFKIS
jgi:hypothetical protein